MRSNSHREFRTAGGFGEGEWLLFIEDLRSNLRNEDNRIGLEGRRLHGVAWDMWLIALMDRGLGNHYWGPGTNKKWRFPEERDKIIPYLKVIVQKSAGYVRDCKRAELRRPTQDPSVDHGDASTSISLNDKPTATPTSSHPSVSGKGLGQAVISRSGARSRKKVLDKILEPIASPSPKRARTSRNSSKTKRSQDGVSSVIEAKETSPTKTETPTSSAVYRPPTLVCENTPSDSIRNPSPSVKNDLLEPSNGTRPVEKTNALATQQPDPVEETDITSTIENPPASPVHQSFRYALETSIAGSINVMLVHAVDVPTIAHFVEVFRQKHRLAPEYEVQGIRVERMGLGNKLIHIDLTDERDWGHVLELLMVHSLRVEVLMMNCQAI